MVNKLWSTKKIYDIIVEVVKQRQALLTEVGEGDKPQDTMQLLLDAGDDRMAVVGVGAFTAANFRFTSWTRCAFCTVVPDVKTSSFMLWH